MLAFWNYMRLQAMLHLQMMLNAAKKLICIKQHCHLFVGDVTAIGEPRNGYERMRKSQPLVAAAMSQLQGLSQKLDLSNATSTKLNVIARSGRNWVFYPSS